MAKRFALLRRINHDRKVTKETDNEFIYLLQTALLLAMREQGRLNPMQHRHAAEKLKQQHRAWTRKLWEGKWSE